MGFLRARLLSGTLMTVLLAVMPGECAAGFAQTANKEVLVVAGSRAPAYGEAVDGLRASLKGADVTVVVLMIDDPGAHEHLSAMLARKPEVVVALGSVAAIAVARVDHTIPVIVTMVLAPASAAPAGGGISAVIVLDLAPGDVLKRLKQIYPARTRVALIRGPALPASKSSAIEEEGRRLGFRIHVVECPSPKELLETFGTLRDRFDFVWFLPDGALYQAPTMSALVLAGIRQRLPIIGFSEGSVRAGALIGFYPDYTDIGAQAGESVLRIVAGQRPESVQHPRAVKAMVNQRVMRVLGLRPATTAPGLVTLQ